MPDQPSLHHSALLYDRARQLRRDMTPAERILWRLLRHRRLAGLKFRRQQPVGPYIADFYCSSAQVIVELDGDSHLGREAHDAARHAALERLGYRVLRFANGQVYDECEGVVEAVWQACSSIGTGSK